MSRNARLGNIIQLIAGCPGITLSQLCTRLNEIGIDVSERTLAKDILLLKSEYNLLPQRSRLREGYSLENIYSLSETDISIVLDALHVFGVQFDAPEARSLASRLCSLLTTPAPKRRTVRQRSIYPKRKGTHVIEETLLSAIRTGMPLTIEHQLPSQRKSQRISGYPMLMVFHERGWYCIMRDLLHKHYSPFRLDRITSVMQPKQAKPNQSREQDQLECEYLMSCGWGMGFPVSREALEATNAQDPIIVRFDSTVAPFILESVQRHPYGKISPVKDGSGDVLLKIKLTEPREFLFWIRSFGSRAWIISPSSLANVEYADALHLAQRYRSQPTK